MNRTRVNYRRCFKPNIEYRHGVCIHEKRLLKLSRERFQLRKHPFSVKPLTHTYIYIVVVRLQNTLHSARWINCSRNIIYEYRVFDCFEVNRVFRVRVIDWIQMFCFLVYRNKQFWRSVYDNNCRFLKAIFTSPPVVKTAVKHRERHMK